MKVAVSLTSRILPLQPVATGEDFRLYTKHGRQWVSPNIASQSPEIETQSVFCNILTFCGGSCAEVPQDSLKLDSLKTTDFEKTPKSMSIM